MAKLLDDTDLTYVSFPIVKVEKTDDGDLLVWGRATDGSVDSDEQIVDPDWSSKALETWLKTGGNVRVMHSSQHLPAGVGVEIAKGDNGDGHWVRSLVVEPIAKRLVEKKVLSAYSIGISSPKIIRDRLAKGGRIVGGAIHELSLVDRPANKNCGITLVKGASAENVEELWGMDADELLDKKKKKPDEPIVAADEPDEDEPTDEGNTDAQGVEPDEDDIQKSQYLAARNAWLDREPAHDANPAPLSGTAFLAKRAAQDAWTRWDVEGEEYGLNGTEAGYERWLTKRAATVEPVTEPSDTTVKGVKDCPSCGEPGHADSKKRKCSKCGAKLPKVKGVDTSLDVAPKGKPFPGGAKPFEAKDDAPDEDADADGPDEEPDEDDKPSYTAKRMHDALCAAFSWDAVVAEYPALKTVGDALAPAYFRNQVTAAAVKGDMFAVAELAGIAQAAEELHAGVVEAAKLADARAYLHKGFTDLYPTQGPVTPTTMTAGQFQRPYIAAGRAPLNAPPVGRAANVPPPTHTPDPDDFQRGLLTAGHAASSPSNKGNNLDAGTLDSGAARSFYRNASQEAARNAMVVMHDHVASTYPGACPMAASKAVMPPNMRDANRPTPVTPPETGKAPGEVTKGQLLSRKDLKKLLKTAVGDATKAVADVYENQIAALQAEIDELGAQPDPAQAPLRGVVRKAATIDGESAPVERVSLVEKAQKRATSERDEEVAYIAKNFLHHADPRLREQGEERLRQLLAS